MKEIKTLIIVIFFSGLLYIGIEPYAHSKLNPAVAPANYDFAAEDIALATTNVEKAKTSVTRAEKIGDEKMIDGAKKELEIAEASLKTYSEFWDGINVIDLSKGDTANGKELFSMACVSCHSLTADGFEPMMSAIDGSNAYGVNPPDLSSAGKIYDAKFLAAVIQKPTLAMKVDHKFDGVENFHPMTEFMGMGGDVNEETADIVAYLKSVAPANMENKEVFVDACVRCHDMKYDEVYVGGDRVALANYLGSNPPDLSMYIRSRGVQYLHEFMNDTQKLLPGTAMPRVGLTSEAEAQVVAYMQDIGDSKKDEREKVSIYIMIYFVILAVFAGLWKKKIWSKLH
ncbi:MAG: c-type cytochrome [Campylobacter sp.]|nr:c-type cytochrome [Campylobacter sp.]